MIEKLCFSLLLKRMLTHDQIWKRNFHAELIRPGRIHRSSRRKSITIFLLSFHSTNNTLKLWENHCQCVEYIHAQWSPWIKIVQSRKSSAEKLDWIVFVYTHFSLKFRRRIILCSNSPWSIRLFIKSHLR